VAIARLLFGQNSFFVIIYYVTTAIGNLKDSPFPERFQPNPQKSTKKTMTIKAMSELSKHIEEMID